jgi:hypothetical protein
MKFTFKTLNGIQLNHRLTLIDINGSLSVFQWFFGTFYTSWSSNPQVMGSNLKISKNFKKRYNIWADIPGNQESED